MNNDLATVVEQDVFVDGAIVLNREIVSKRHFHSVEYLYVLPAMLEDVPSQHGPHPEPQPVIKSCRRSVKHHPKPDQWLALSIFGSVHIPIVFRFQRSISRIKRMYQRLRG